MSRPIVGSEQFLILPENRLGHTAVTRWAESRRAGPLVYLYGPSGAGKSHLARHGLRLLASRRPDLRVVHQEADEFAAELAAASTRKSIARFQSGLRDLECLILEDLHSLENRPETQQQLLSTLDELLPQGCRLLFTSRKSPGELHGMLPKLIDRFHGGVTALVRLPGLESRQSLLEHFAAARKLSLSPDLASLIARKMPVSPRELLGLVVQLEMRSRAEQRPIDVSLVRQTLSGTMPPRTVRMDEIARAVAKHFRVSLADLRSPVRSRTLMLPRHCAMMLSRELTDEGLVQIGKFFNRNHSTVVHACDQIRDKAADDPSLRSHLAQLRRTLGAGPAPVEITL